MSFQVQLQHEFYDRLMDSQYAASEKRNAIRETQLARLLRHARDHVPFYATRLEPVFTPTGDIDFSRWNEIPTLKRDDLLNSRDAMFSQALPRLQGRVLTDTTTGSTGAPVTVSRSEYSASVHAAVICRGRSWHDLDWSGNLLAWTGDDEMPVMPTADMSGPAWGPPWLSQSRGVIKRLSRFANAGTVLDFLLRWQPKYLTTRPKSAQFLAFEAERLGIDLRLDAVLGHSTGVLDDEREDCRRVFGARMIGQYASKEAQSIAFQCPTGPHYHVNDESTWVEILREDGSPCPPGVVGRVVVTSIFNLAQPIIRYEQGDLAALGEACSCGRTLSVIDRIVGRTTHLFRFPDGTKVSPVIPSGMLPKLNARYWQIAQTEPLHIEVRYVPAGPPPSADAERAVAEVIRDRTHPKVSVGFVAVQPEALNKPDGSKFITFVYEVHDSN